MALSADGSRIYAGGLSRALLCLNADGKEQWKLPTAGYVMALMMDEKSGLVTAGISNGEILGIEAATGKVAWKASSSVSERGVARSIECLAAQKGGGLIAAGTQGGEAILISTKGEVVKRWKGKDEWITDVAFVGNGRLAASTWSGRIEFFGEAGHQ